MLKENSIVTDTIYELKTQNHELQKRKQTLERALAQAPAPSTDGSVPPPENIPTTMQTTLEI